MLLGCGAAPFRRPEPMGSATASRPMQSAFSTPPIGRNRNGPSSGGTDAMLFLKSVREKIVGESGKIASGFGPTALRDGPGEALKARLD
jgi:hypothetical protein